MAAVTDKKLNGVVYTPRWVVAAILGEVGYGKAICDKRIIDPACGDGAFLCEVARRFIADAKRQGINTTILKKRLATHIVGFDIDSHAIKQCIAHLDSIALEAGLKNIRWHINKGDSLDKKAMRAYLGTFDFVVGNPPYVRIQHLGERKRQRIQKDWLLCQKGSTDIFITFFELGVQLLNDSGQLGYITPNTYLKTQAGKALRDFIKTNQFLKTLIDFEHHQLFDNATTYSLITILDKAQRGDLFSLYKGDSQTIRFVDTLCLRDLNDDNWILTSKRALRKIQTIEKRGLPLSQIAKIHVGITTLADDLYIFKNPVLDEQHATITLKDGRVFKIERSILKPIVKVSVLKDASEEQNRYVIFPYQRIGYKEKGKHTLIPETRLKESFPLTYRYLRAVKPLLDARDKGKPNKAGWYAFGRSQGLDTSFGNKILTSSMNLKPNFLVWEKPDHTFYAGYCVKYEGDLHHLAARLNSDEMAFYINHVSRCYQKQYKSFAKSFIENFGIDDSRLLGERGEMLLEGR